MERFSLGRRVAAEALGTGLLVAVVVGSGIMAESLTKDVALALLANAIATASGLVVLISTLGPISGAHFNPAVSLVFALHRTLTWRDFSFYAAAQVIGGVLGVWLAHAMFQLPVLQFSEKVRHGGAQWLAELVATFGLVMTILLALRFAKERIPTLVALYIAAAYWFTASTSFANPAVAIARSLTNTFSGIRPLDLPGFIVAELGGAIFALLMVGWLIGRPVNQIDQNK